MQYHIRIKCETSALQPSAVDFLLGWETNNEIRGVGHALFCFPSHFHCWLFVNPFHFSRLFPVLLLIIITIRSSLTRKDPYGKCSLTTSLFPSYLRFMPDYARCIFSISNLNDIKHLHIVRIPHQFTISPRHEYIKTLTFLVCLNTALFFSSISFTYLPPYFYISSSQSLYLAKVKGTRTVTITVTALLSKGHAIQWQHFTCHDSKSWKHFYVSTNLRKPYTSNNLFWTVHQSLSTATIFFIELNLIDNFSPFTFFELCFAAKYSFIHT